MGSPSLNNRKKPPWRKVLYERQPYPDNYVPESFLEQLVTNADVKPLGLGAYITRTLVVTQQLACVASFFAFFLALADGSVPAHIVVSVDLLFLGTGYGSMVLLEPVNGAGGGREKRIQEMVGPLLLFLICLRITAPLLRMLTASYADDSIYALAITLCGVHLLLHDYCYANATTTVFKGTLSLNAAMFVTVLLASRLETDELVFGLVLLGMVMFALFPVWRHRIKLRKTLALNVAITSFLVLTAGFLLVEKSSALAMTYVFAVTVVSFGGPLCMVLKQPRKMRVQGPWDVATMDLSGDAASADGVAPVLQMK